MNFVEDLCHDLYDLFKQDKGFDKGKFKPLYFYKEQAISEHQIDFPFFKGSSN